MQISIYPNGPTPIAEQIRHQVAESIAAYRLRPGDRLTPPTQLAEQLVTSPTAVLRAYRALEREGLCHRNGRGFEVARASLDVRREWARLHQLMGSRQSLLDELELARKIQGRLMPPSPIVSDGWALAAAVHAAEFVSGDFFEVLPRETGVVDVVVADVSGKGIGASLIMALVKARLPMLPADLPVAEVLGRLNEQLFADLGRRQFVAASAVRLCGRSGRLEVANAGLPDPYLLRAGEQPEVVRVPGPRLPLGMRAGGGYLAAELSLEPGDRLLLYTDGIPEAPTLAGEVLGYEALARLVEEEHAGPARSTSPDEPLGAETWLDGLLERIAAATERLPVDDQTAVLLERRRT